MKNHWAIPISSRHLNHTWEAYDGNRYIKACGRKFLNGALPESAEDFTKRATMNPDWYCADCTKASRLALTKKSAQKELIGTNAHSRTDSERELAALTMSTSQIAFQRWCA